MVGSWRRPGSRLDHAFLGYSLVKFLGEKVISSILASAAEEAHVQLPFPAVFFGVIGMAVFILLGLITFSYRDVANRHDHKSGNSSAHH
jgi:hypothetical protein